MNPDALAYVDRSVIPATFALLPESMRSDRARALLLAIGLQESGFLYRVQVGGPARGYWQFERGGGIRGVLAHEASSHHLPLLLRTLNYPRLEAPCYEAVAHNDVLACGFARLLLWTLPEALPGPADADRGWTQYLRAWRPGKPHAHTWRGHFDAAWAVVNTDREVRP